MKTAAIYMPDGLSVRVELAITREQQVKGLQGRRYLFNGAGMLFVFPTSGYHSIWMAHCLIPLDIIWLDELCQVVEMALNTNPCPNGVSPQYGNPNIASRYVLEIGAGQALQHGIAIGSMFGLIG